MRHAGRRGYAAWLILVVIGAISTVLLVGLDRRIGELAIENNTLCRAAARSAAESGIARARSRVERGETSARGAGELSEGPGRSRVSYTFAIDSGRVSAEGRCTPPNDARESVVSIHAELKRGAFTAWRESGSGF